MPTLRPMPALRPMRTVRAFAYTVHTVHNADNAHATVSTTMGHASHNATETPGEPQFPDSRVIAHNGDSWVILGTVPLKPMVTPSFSRITDSRAPLGTGHAQTGKVPTTITEPIHACTHPFTMHTCGQCVQACTMPPLCAVPTPCTVLTLYTSVPACTHCGHAGTCTRLPTMSARAHHCAQCRQLRTMGACVHHAHGVDNGWAWWYNGRVIEDV